MRIGIKGYQSLQKVLINAPPGQLVGVRGANNVGKSAIARAVSAFIKNQPSTNFIKRGESETMVVVKNDQEFKWVKRDKGEGYYVINGKVEKKIGRMSIHEVNSAARFFVEKEGSSIFVPSVVPENEKIFPFNMSPSGAFKVFSKFMSSPKVGEILKLLKKQIKDQQEELKIKNGAVDTYEKELSGAVRKLESLPDDSLLTRLIEGATKVVQATIKMEQLEDDIARLKELGQESVMLEQRREKVKRFHVSFKAEVVSFVQKAGEIQAIENLVPKMKKASERHEILTIFIEKVSPKLSLFRDALEEMGKISLLRRERNRVKGELEQLFQQKTKAEEARAEFKHCPLCKRPF